jgi:hypothetical protein
MLLDKIWMREMEDLGRLRDPMQMFPMILFTNAHAKFRIALELGFSCCLGEAWDTVRGAIESVAHAHKLIREPQLLAVWFNKDHGKQQDEAFRDAFERNKKDSLFPTQHGLDKLHRYYSEFSEWGTHTTVTALSQRFHSNESSTDVEWKLIYTGAQPSVLALSLFSLFLASFLMEKAFFGVFENRLQFDVELSKMRSKLDHDRQRTAQEIINRLGLTPPTIWTVS